MGSERSPIDEPPDNLRPTIVAEYGRALRAWGAHQEKILVDVNWLCDVLAEHAKLRDIADGNGGS